MAQMFKNVYYDKMNKVMKIWMFDGTIKTYKNTNHFWYTTAIKSDGTTKYKDVHGNPVNMHIGNSGDEYRAKQAGGCHEADIPYEMRFLDMMYRKDDTLDLDINNLNTCIIDIEVEAEKINGQDPGFPEPHEAQQRINLITCFSTVTKKYTTFGLEKDIDVEIGELNLSSPEYTWEYVKCADEITLMSKFIRYINDEHIDVISGWNTFGFDMPYIVKRCSRLGLDSNMLSPVFDVKWINGNFSEDTSLDYYINIGGISQLDYIMLYKKYAKDKQPNYRLDTVAMAELGEGKVSLHEGLYSEYKTDWKNFVIYNIKDVDLVVQLNAKLKLIQQAVSFCSVARVPLEWNFIVKRMVVGTMMKFLHDRGIVVPAQKLNHEHMSFEGAYTRANPGFYHNVVSYDFKSMYPSILMGANISVETKIPFSKTEDRIAAGTCAISTVKWAGTDVPVCWDNTVDGIMPSFTKFMFDTRDRYKQAMLAKEKEDKWDEAYIFDMIQSSYKILCNSIYGLLASPYFQLYDRENSASIANIGKNLIQYSIDHVISYIDHELEHDERFKAEFGDYADVKIKGKVTSEYLTSRFGSVEFMGKTSTYKRVVLVDTDSFFLDYSDIYAPYADKMTLTEFTTRLEKALFGEVRRDIMDAFCKEYGWRNMTLFLKVEKCANSMLISATKKYLVMLESNEGVWLGDKPLSKRIKATGIELVRSSTSKFAKDALKNIVEHIFSTVSLPDVLEMFNKYKEQFMTSDLGEIATPTGISSLEANAAGVMPIDRRAANIWNQCIKKIPAMKAKSFEPARNGCKIKWLYVRPNNIFSTDVMAYIGNEYPRELDDVFEIDYDKHFQATFARAVDRLTVAMGWGAISNIVSASIDEFFE